MSYLSAEIIDEILTASQLTLSDQMQCGLVCSDWLSSTRRIGLFQAITVTNINADAFASVIINASSTLPFCVRKLRLHTNATWLRRLLPFLDSLQQLTGLEVQDLDWTTVDVPTRKSFCRIFKSVRELKLGPGTHFEELLNATDIICQFSSLEKIEIDRASWNRCGLEDDSLSATFASEKPTPQKLPPTFRHFAVKGCIHRDLLQWILTLDPTPRIQEIELGQLNPFKMGNIHAFFEAVGGTVQIISISFDTTEWDEGGFIGTHHPHHAGDISNRGAPAYNMLKSGDVKLRCAYAVNPPDLGMLHALHTLRLGNFICYTKFAYASAISYAVGILQWLVVVPRSSRMRKIILEVWLGKVADVDRYIVDWDRMDQLLVKLLVDEEIKDSQVGSVQSRLGEETSLGILIGGGADREALSALIRSRLVLCDRLGLIKTGPLSSDVEREARGGTRRRPLIPDDRVRCRMGAT